MTRKLLAVFLLLSLFALTAGCGLAAKPAIKLDSGVTNDSYQGVAQPTLEKKLKLSEEELKNGIKKVPIHSNTGQILSPEKQVTDLPAEGGNKAGGSDAAKPQI